MQYILTEEEYNGLISKKIYQQRCDEIIKLNKLVLKYADFKCIHERTREDEDVYGYDDYCDDCPLARTMTCNSRKNFSQ